MRTLVVKTHAFGDSLLATPAVTAMIAAGEKVTVLSGPSSFPVWNRLPGIEGVVRSPAPCSTVKLLWWSLFNGQKDFDRVVHFGSSSSAFKWLGFLTGKRVISGGDGKTGFGLVEPAARDYCRIAGVSCSSLKPVSPVSPSEFAAVEQYSSNQPYVVLAPGGARNVRDFVPMKRWPISRWKAISLYLKKKGYRVFLVGGAFDTTEISSVDGVNLAGKLSWGETAALISKATLFAGNDSGPAHLAVAFETPAVVLFGPTDPWSLYEKDSIVPVCGTVPCSPCYANSLFPGCTGNEDCMISIDTERVQEILEEMLQK